MSQQVSGTQGWTSDDGTADQPLALIAGLEGNLAAVDRDDVERIAAEGNSMSSLGALGHLQERQTLRSPATGAAGLEASERENVYQLCSVTGGYSQISTDNSDIIFHAWTWTSGSGCGGTVTFEYEISDNQTGQQITRGSVTRSFSGGSPAYNEFRYPHPGGSVWVELKTIHTVGSTTTHNETSGVY